MSDDLWRTLLEVDRASNELPRLAMEVLIAQRQSDLDVSRFTKDEVTRLIELIEARVRVPQPRTYVVRVQHIAAPSTRGHPKPSEEHRFRDPKKVVRSIPTTAQILPHR